MPNTIHPSDRLCRKDFDMPTLARLLVGNRDPDQIVDDTVDGVDVPYLLRWYIKRADADLKGVDGNVFLHCFLRSDYDRALHNHPWDSCSIILDGEYLEYVENHISWHRRPGDIIMRAAKHAHRVELIDGKPCWSLFITGPKYREWGFLTGPNGWVHWAEFEKDRG